MPSDVRRARDLGLLDAVDRVTRESLETTVLRVVREGRDPLLGSPSLTRWCNGNFDVLYTSFDRDGAIAEIHSFLALQPVFPSKVRYFASQIRVGVTQTLRLADFNALTELGVEPGRYQERDYGRTQDIADAAYFLGFDGVIAPSARWSCLNLVLFTDRIPPDHLELVERPTEPIAWEDWRKRRRV